MVISLWHSAAEFSKSLPHNFVFLFYSETANNTGTSPWGCVGESLPAVSLFSSLSSVKSYSSTDMQGRNTRRRRTGLSTHIGNRRCPGQQAQRTEPHWYPGGKRKRRSINNKGKASLRQVMKFQEIHHYMNYQLNLEATIVLNRKVTFGSKNIL